jgi:hypothetical protein
MDVLKTRAHRKIVLVVETKDRAIRVEVSGDNAEDMYKNAVERLKGLASPESS